MQQGFGIGIVLIGLLTVGIGGAVTYVGLRAIDSKNSSDSRTQSVSADTEESKAASNDSGAVKSNKEGKLVSQIGSGFAEKLQSCQASTTEFTHPFTQVKLKRIIEGLKGSTCTYVEEMPNNGKMTCKLNETTRSQYAGYFGQIAAGNEMSASSSMNETSSSGTTLVDGKPLSFDPNTLLNDGTCVISGY